MAPERSGRRRASPLLKELRRWERRARRGLLPPDHLLPAWEQAIAQAQQAESIEAAEMERRLGLILRARVTAHVADLEATLHPDQPLPGSPLSRPSLRRLSRELERASGLGVDVADTRARLGALRQAHLNARLRTCELLASTDPARALQEVISLWAALVEAEVESGAPGSLQSLTSRIVTLQGRLEANVRGSMIALDRTAPFAVGSLAAGPLLPISRPPALAAVPFGPLNGPFTPNALVRRGILLAEDISRHLLGPAPSLGFASRVRERTRSPSRALPPGSPRAAPDDVYPPLDRPFATIQVELDWIDGQPEPWQRPELVEQARALIESFARQGTQIRIVRGRPVTPDQYDPASAQPASTLAALASISPVGSGDLDILENAVLRAGRPGFLHVIIPPASASGETRAGHRSQVAGQLTPDSGPSRPELPLIFPFAEADETEAVGALQEPSPPAAIPTARLPGGVPSSFGRYPRLAGTTRFHLATAQPMLTPSRTPVRANRPLVRTSLQREPGTVSLPPLPPPALQRETDPEALLPRAAQARRVRIVLDWVAGESPRHRDELLARAREAARLLEARGVSVQINRGRAVPAHRYDGSLARQASDFSIPGPTGPVTLDSLDVLEQSMLVALRPGLIRVLVAPSDRRESYGEAPPRILPRIEPEHDLEAVSTVAEAIERASDADTAPEITGSREVSRPTSTTVRRQSDARPSIRPGSGSRRDVLPSAPSGLGRRSVADSAGPRATRQLSPPQGLPFGSRSFPRSRPTRFPATLAPVRIVLDWVAGENPWQRPDTAKRVSETERALAALGLHVELIRGHAVPTHRYSANQERRAAELSLPGPTGPVALSDLDLLDRAAVVVQRPGFLQLVVPPTRPSVGSPMLGRKTLPGSSVARPAGMPSRDWISGHHLDLVWAADATSPSVGSRDEDSAADSSRMGREPAPTREQPGTQRGTVSQSNRLPGTGRVQVVVDWVAGQDPWREPSRLSVPPAVARSLRHRGIQIELVRGRAVPASTYQSAQALPAGALSVIGPRGPVSLGALSWLEGAVPIAQRPGRLQVVLPGETARFGAYATTAVSLTPFVEERTQDAPGASAAADTASTGTASPRLSVRSAPGTTTLGAAWTLPGRRTSGHTVTPPRHQPPTVLASILGPAGGPADSPGESDDAGSGPSPMPAPQHAGIEPSSSQRGTQLASRSMLFVPPWNREPGSGRSPVEQLPVSGLLEGLPTTNLRTPTSARSGAGERDSLGAPIPLVGSVGPSAPPMNVLIFDVERAAPELPPMTMPIGSGVQHPAIGEAVTHVAAGATVQPSPPSRAPAAAVYPPLTFAKGAAPEVLPLRQQDVARAPSNRPPVEPGRAATPTASSSTEAATQPAKEPKRPDLDALARQVYALIKQRLIIEKERMGVNRAIRPW